MEALNLKTLRAQHPDLYEAVVQEGHDRGVKQERDRVCAHLTMGEQSGDLKTAFGAIRDGQEMTMTLQAQYLTAGMNKAARATYQQETDAAGKVIDGASKAPEVTEDDIDARTLQILEERRGKKVSNG